MDPKRLVPDGHDGIGDAYTAHMVEGLTLDDKWYLDTLAEHVPQSATLAQARRNLHGRPQRGQQGIRSRL